MIVNIKLKDMKSSGHLQLKIVSGKLIRDVETFGKMDPYVTCIYMGQKYKTIINEDGGKTPVWNHTFDIPIGSVQDDLEFHLKDNNVIGAEEIGSSILKASSLCINNGVREWFTFTYQGTEAG
jgi:Ca2+-dependent lipid-binding protein